MTFAPESEALRRRMLNPWLFGAYLWKNLPLAACAGIRLEGLDESRCDVRLPGGWRTRNPFRSTYFAAQLMAAELSTGAPAMVLVAGAKASVALILVEIKGGFGKKIVGPSRFSCEGVAELAAAVERAAGQAEPLTHVARSVGRGEDGVVAAEFDVTWSFKRRS